jgi:hypothetical protein
MLKIIVKVDRLFAMWQSNFGLSSYTRMNLTPTLQLSTLMPTSRP